MRDDGRPATDDEFIDAAKATIDRDTPVLFANAVLAGDRFRSSLAQTRSRLQEVEEEMKRIREPLDRFMVDHGMFHPDFWAAGLMKKRCRACDLCAALAALDSP